MRLPMVGRLTLFFSLFEVIVLGLSVFDRRRLSSLDGECRTG
jgi:hypothetical protein